MELSPWGARLSAPEESGPFRLPLCPKKRVRSGFRATKARAQPSAGAIAWKPSDLPPGHRHRAAASSAWPRLWWPASLFAPAPLARRVASRPAGWKSSPRSRPPADAPSRHCSRRKEGSWRAARRPAHISFSSAWEGPQDISRRGTPSLEFFLGPPGCEYYKCLVCNFFNKKV
jgi:hypothetical protein